MHRTVDEAGRVTNAPLTAQEEADRAAIETSLVNRETAAQALVDLRATSIPMFEEIEQVIIDLDAAGTIALSDKAKTLIAQRGNIRRRRL
jgi:hypothetical protein